MKFRAIRLWPLAGVLFGLLIWGVAILYLGRPSAEVDPGSGSFEPSGCQAFAALLEASGYEVERSRVFPFAAAPNTLLIAFSPRRKPVPEEQLSRPQTPETRTASEDNEKFDMAWESARRQAKGGGGMLLLLLDSEPLSAAEPAAVTLQSGLSEKTHRQIRPSHIAPGPMNLPRGSEVRFDAWSASGEPFVTLEALGKGSGLVATVADGTVALNQYLERDQNAQVLLELVRMVGPGIKRVRFIDGSFSGVGRAGILDVLGPWAHGAWSQLLLVCAAIAWGMGIRFGLLEKNRIGQRSSREMLDGIADTMGRASHLDWALASVASSVDRRVRHRLGLSADAPAEDRNRLLSTDLRNALRDAELPAASLTGTVALAKARELERLASEWLAERSDARPGRRG